MVVWMVFHLVELTVDGSVVRMAGKWDDQKADRMADWKASWTAALMVFHLVDPMVGSWASLKADWKAVHWVGRMAVTTAAM